MRRDIPGYGGAYQITTDGEVYSCDRLQKGRIPGYMSLRLGRKLKTSLTKGYQTVALCKESKIKRVTVHRLVWITFKGRINNGLQVNHIDGNKLNNKLSNLEVVSSKENTQHAWKLELAKKRFGEKTSMAKLNPEKVKKIRALYQQGFSQNEIAKKFCLTQTNIHCILVGKTWSHVA